jgi:LPXTG-site transpeptidase (sortase) family protein
MNRKFGTALIILAILVAGYTLWKAFYFPSDDTGIPAANNDSVVAAAVSAGKTVDTNKTGTSSSSDTSSGAAPVRIQIPKLKVDAKVVPVGITKSGLMDAPHNFTDTGWYKLGTIPGNIGSAVIDGHEDNAIDLDGVFKHLDQLSPGDDIYIVRQDGKKLHFQVEKSAIYAYNDTTHLNEIFKKSDASRLNLITCSGKWVQAIHTNDKRIVVFTKLVD